MWLLSDCTARTTETLSPRTSVCILTRGVPQSISENNDLKTHAASTPRESACSSAVKLEFATIGDLNERQDTGFACTHEKFVSVFEVFKIFPSLCSVVLFPSFESKQAKKPI